MTNDQIKEKLRQAQLHVSNANYRIGQAVELLNLSKQNCADAYSEITEVLTGLAQSPRLRPKPDSVSTLASGEYDVLLQPYSSVIYQVPRSFTMYYRGWNKHLRCISSTGLPGSWWSSNVVEPNIGYGAVTKAQSQYVNLYHEWVGSNCVNHTKISSNGRDFTEIANNIPYSGEDRSLFWDASASRLLCYIRPRPKPRYVGVTASFDEGRTWTPIITVIPFNQDNFNDVNHVDYRKHWYSMSVCRVGERFWGLLNVLRLGDQGQDTEQVVCNGAEQTVEVELCTSLDGLTWQRCSPGYPYIPLTGDWKQIYAMPTVVDNELWIYAMRSKRRHTNYENSIVSTTKNYFEIVRFVQPLSELNSWL